MIKTIKRQRQSDWMKEQDQTSWRNTLQRSKRMQCRTEKETQMYRTVFKTPWEKARVGCFKRTASKHVYYLG